MNILLLIAELEEKIAADELDLRFKKEILEALKTKAKDIAPHFDNPKEEV